MEVFIIIKKDRHFQRKKTSTEVSKCHLLKKEPASLLQSEVLTQVKVQEKEEIVFVVKV